jgi:glutathione peroxidase
MKKIIATIKYMLLMLVSPKKTKTVGGDNQAPVSPTKSFYDFTMKSIDGKEIPFSIYKGKKVLVVNTASECGYTPQYKELEKLNQQYKDKLVVLGFPANNFGGQEPSSNQEIATFCERNFGVTFQLFQKSDVVGENQNALYHWLTTPNENGWNKTAPSWNFCKYLISEKGELLKFYSAAIDPLSTEMADAVKK